MKEKIGFRVKKIKSNEEKPQWNERSSMFKYFYDEMLSFYYLSEIFVNFFSLASLTYNWSTGIDLIT